MQRERERIGRKKEQSIDVKASVGVGRFARCEEEEEEKPRPFFSAHSLPPTTPPSLQQQQVDVDRIRRDNEARTDAQRKGGLIIWSGPNPTKAMKDRWQVEAKAKYGLTPEQLAAVEAEFEERVGALRKGGGGGGGAAEGGGGSGKGGVGVGGEGGGAGTSSAGGGASGQDAERGAALEAGVSSLLAASESAAAKPLARDAKLVLLKELREKLAEVAAAVADRDAEAARRRKAKAEAEAMVTRFQSDLAALAVPGDKASAAMYYPNGYTAGAGTLSDEILTLTW